MKAICNVSVAPLRKEPSEKVEMVTQMLFGESCDILEEQKYWTKVKMHYDGYEGWTDTQQISVMTEEDLAKRTFSVVMKTVGMYDLQQGNTLLSIGSEVFTKNPEPLIKGTRESISSTARLFLNVPYLWSGRSFFGVDCSGFVQLVYKVHGISLPRESALQAEIGEVLSFVEESKPGDLAFFENEEGQICHVGIMVNHQEIIHAFGKVRIDSLDSTGIFNKDLKKHTHKLRFLRSIF